jgi:PKD repeat protein
MTTRRVLLAARAVAVAALAASLLLGASCLFWNQAPTARISASATSGTSPLGVRFDASRSTDDGRIFNYQWDFGDGASAFGSVVTHTFLAVGEARTYTVVLTVTDEDGRTDEARQTVEVQAGLTPDERPLTARIRAGDTLGPAPFEVTFDGSDSTGIGRPIELYRWDFGDGDSATGEVVTHVFDPDFTSYFTVQLTVVDDEGRQGIASVVVTVLVPEAGAEEEPHAEFTASEPNVIYESPSPPNPPSIFEVELNPEGCWAAPGELIVSYIWNLGDGEAATFADNEPFTHLYTSGAPSHTFVVSLTIADSQGLTDTATRNVTIVQPAD